MRHLSWQASRRFAQVFLGALLALTAVAAVRGEVRGGYFASTDPNRQSFGDWILFASANTTASVAMVVAVSSVFGSVLAAATGLRRARWLGRALELSSTLPGVVLALLWLSNSPNSPLMVVTLVVAGQRTFQVGFLVNQTRLQRLIPDHPDMYSTAEFQKSQLRRWRSVLWLAGAQSAGLVAALEAAIVLLGFAPNLPYTWTSTLCTAVRGAPPTSAMSIVVAALGSVALPGALWVLGESGVTRKLALAEQPSSFRDSSPSDVIE